MSIVENALNKVRAKTADDGAARTESRAETGTQARRSPVAPRIEPLPVAAPAPPARSVTLDDAALGKYGLLVPSEFVRRVREDYRRIKWPMLEVALDRSTVKVEHSKLIMVASALPNEGKSFSAFNLALAFAAERHCSVLLIDADIARPKLTRAFGLEQEPGLVDLLSDDSLTLDDVVLGTSIANLSFVPAGRAHSDNAELLGGQRMERLARELAARPQGNIIVFDSSPLLATNEAQVLSRLMGQVAMVVKAGETPREAVKGAIELISKTAAVGLVLNHYKNAFGAPYHGDYYEHDRS